MTDADVLAALDADLTATLTCGWSQAADDGVKITEDGADVVPVDDCTGTALFVIRFAAVCEGGGLTGLPGEIMVCRPHFALAAFLEGRCYACGMSPASAASHTITDVHLIHKPDVR